MIIHRVPQKQFGSLDVIDSVVLAGWLAGFYHFRLPHNGLWDRLFFMFDLFRKFRFIADDAVKFT
jgi:hypothetical protein